MITLYDPYHVKIGGLINYKDLQVIQEINYPEELLFKYPVKDPKTELIKLEGYIRTNTNEYVIKEINIIDELYIEVIGKINLGDFNIPLLDTSDPNCRTLTVYKNWWWEIDHYVYHSAFTTIEDAIIGSQIKAQTIVGDEPLFKGINIWSVIDHIDYDINDGFAMLFKYREVTVRRPVTLYNLLEVIREVYGLELVFDSINRIIHIYIAEQAPNRGSYFIDELNLINITSQNTSYNHCTYLIPLGYERRNISKVDVPNPIISNRPMLVHPEGRVYLKDTTHSDKVIFGFFEDEYCTDRTKLIYDGARELILRSDPNSNISYTINIMDLSNNSNYSILSYHLGDEIKIISKSKNIEITKRIVKKTMFLDEPERNTCVLGTYSQNLIKILEDGTFYYIGPDADSEENPE